MNAQTKMSVKGQVVIPKDVRDALAWREGLELDVVQGRDSVTLKPKDSPRKTITLAEFHELVPPYDGPAIPESEWRGSIETMFREEWSKYNK